MQLLGRQINSSADDECVFNNKIEQPNTQVAICDKLFIYITSPLLTLQSQHILRCQPQSSC